MRAFWAGMTAQQQAETEAAAFYFVTTHSGLPAVPAVDLADFAIPGDFPGEVISSLDSRTTRIELEVPKTDLEKLGWDPTYFPNSIRPDPDSDVPLKLRGCYIKGDGLLAACNEGNPDDNDDLVHPLIILSSGFQYSISYDQLVGGIDVWRQMRKAPPILSPKDSTF